jgi:ketosteroid isomerase-like protein
MTVPTEEIGVLVERSDRANAALMKGDADGYRALIAHTPDYTLMAPFGGRPTRQAELDEARWQSVGRFFRNGSFSQELVQAYGGRDMAVLVTIERPVVEVGGLAAQEWALRVTQVYRRDASGWSLAHRHADPLHHGISLEHAAALGRGDHLKPL